MSYSIGAVAERMGLPTSTLRYYDKEGLLPDVGRTDSGLRVFDEGDLQSLRMIECLKKSGLSIKDIKQFMDWCQEGDATIEKRRAMFYERRRAVQQEMDQLQHTLDVIEYKCWFYDTAVEKGSTEAVRSIPSEELPPRMRRLKEEL